MDTADWPQFLPIGDYRINIRFVTSVDGKDEFLFLTKDYYEVRPIGLIEF